MPSKPLISIGVPVYNDATWLPKALDQLVSQDYPNLELIIADDGSTDGSLEICRKYAGRDQRIRLFENKHNLGGWGNHRFVFDVSRGAFFAWGSGHDYFELSYISRLYEELDANPTVAQCCPKSVYYKDEKTYKPPRLLDTRGLEPRERIRSLMDFRLAGGSIDVFYGLYRSEVLARVKIGRDVVSADEIMLAELSFLGELLQIDDVLIHKVNTRGNINVRANRESYRAHLDRNKLSKGTLFKEYLPRLYSFVEYMNMVDSGPISMEEKEILHGEIRNEAQAFSRNIEEEIRYFVEHFSKETPTLESFPLVQKIQAIQIMSALDFAGLLGFKVEGMHELRMKILSILNGNFKIKEDTMRDGETPSKPGLINKIRHFIHHFAGGIFLLPWSKMRSYLRNIFSLHFLLLVWIVSVILLYLLLFSPPLYWGILHLLGIATTLVGWRMYIIDLLDLTKGFH